MVAQRHFSQFRKYDRFRLERQVAAFPDKLALVTDQISLTYGALNLKANRIAAALASLPFQRERPIALLMKEEVARMPQC